MFDDNLLRKLFWIYIAVFVGLGLLVWEGIQWVWGSWVWPHLKQFILWSLS